MASTNTSGGWDGFLQNTVNGRRYFNNKTFDARAFTYSFINKTFLNQFSIREQQ